MDTLVLLPRLLGFFLLSPLFLWIRLPFFLRISLALLFGFLLAPFVATKVHFTLSNLLIEAIIGYVIGFGFALIFEGVALAGELIGNMTGFSYSNLFSPIGQLSLPLLSRLFTLLAITLFFALDLHHLVLKILFNSFEWIPIGFPINLNTESHFFTLASLLFHQALSFALLPLFLLFLFLLFLALTSRLFPEFHFLSFGLPLQILLGLVAITLALTDFPEVLSSSFSQIKMLLEKILLDSTLSP